MLQPFKIFQEEQICEEVPLDSIIQLKHLKQPKEINEIKEIKQPKEIKQQEINDTKKKSQQFEHINISSIIGLSNIFLDKELTINIPKSEKQPESFRKLSIEIEKDENYSTTTIIGNKSFESEKQLTKNEKENERKTNQANILNELSVSIISLVKDYKHSKGRTANETVEFKKYKYIFPFNEKGYWIFGKEVLRIFEEMKEGIDDEEIEENQKRKKVKLFWVNPKILFLFFNLLKDELLLSDYGKMFAKVFIEKFQGWVNMEKENVLTNDVIQIFKVFSGEIKSMLLTEIQTYVN